MEKRYENKKRFGKEDGGTAAKNEILESFIRDAGGRAYQVAYGLAGNRADAEELVQEALYRVTRGWEQYEVCKPLDSWFFAILRNAFIDSRRRFERRKGVSLDAPLDGGEGASLAERLGADEESAHRALERAEAVAAVRRVVASLTKKHRAVLTLCDIDGARYTDTARSLGLKLGTVRSRLFRARQAVRNQLAQVVA